MTDPPPGTADSGAPDNGHESDAGMPNDSGIVEGRDSGPPDTGGPTFDEELASAIPLPTDGTRVDGVIDSAGDVDSYRIAGVAGQYVWIRVRRVSLSRVDPVATLLDTSGVIVAVNDDVDVDTRSSEIVYRMLADGPYLLRVEDWRSWSPDSPMAEGGPQFTYTVSAEFLDNENEAQLVATEVGDDDATAEHFDFPNNTYVIVAGAFDSEDDVDVFRFEIERDTGIRVEFLPPNPMEVGPTRRPLRMTMTSSDGAVVGLADLGENSVMRAPVRRGTYFLRVAHPGGGVGANDFYAMRIRLELFRFLPEPLADDNDELTSTASVAVREGALTHVLGSLPEGDVDVFSYEQLPGQAVLHVLVVSRRWGAGIEDLKVELFNEEEVLVGRAVETAERAAFIPTDSFAPGRITVRISRGSQKLNNPLDFYLFEIWGR